MKPWLKIAAKWQLRIGELRGNEPENNRPFENGLHIEDALVYTGHARKNAVLTTKRSVFLQRAIKNGRTLLPQPLKHSEVREARGPILRLGKKSRGSHRESIPRIR